MDRIDPAHIFRILNVFSAHWDMQDYSEQKLENGNPMNKYNFDKILLVCHFQNIKNIFHHFYGTQTDFTGYIHKFSSSAPYEYSLRDVIENWILRKIPLNHKLYPDICTHLTSLIMQKYANKIDIITNIRHITNFLNHPVYNIRKQDIEFGKILYDGLNYYINSDNQVTRLLCILKNFNISIDDFLGCFNSASTDKRDKQHEHEQICHLISQCWVVYPYYLEEKSESPENSFKFTQCEKSALHIESQRDKISIPCKTQERRTATKKKYKIENIEMDKILQKTRLKPLFCSSQRYKAILSYFQQYIY